MMSDPHRLSSVPCPLCDVKALVTALLLLTVVLTGCDSSDATEDDTPEIAELEISPDSVSLQVGSQVDFSVAALTADGDTVDGADIEWASTDTNVFTVQDNGVATGKNPGTAFCTVGLDETSPSSARAAAKARVPIGLDSAVVHIF